MLIKFQDRAGVINLQNCTSIRISPYINSPKIDSSILHGELMNQKMYIYADDICIGGYSTLQRAKEVLKAVCSAYEDDCYCMNEHDYGAGTNRPYLFMKNSVFEMPEK